MLSYERVFHNSETILDRPDNADKSDPERLTQTHLEQTFANRAFREVARFLENVSYLHLVPQLVRHAEKYAGPRLTNDPFGLNFMDRLAKTPKGKRTAFLERVGKALRVAVPQFKKLSYVEDKEGNLTFRLSMSTGVPKGPASRKISSPMERSGCLGCFGRCWKAKGFCFWRNPNSL